MTTGHDSPPVDVTGHDSPPVEVTGRDRPPAENAVVVAVGSFQHEAVADDAEEVPLLQGPTGYEKLEFAHGRGAAVGESLTALGYALHGGKVLTDPTHQDTRASLDTALRATPPAGGLIVHLISHGHTDASGSLRIALHDSGPHDGLDVESWLRDLERPDHPSALVMLDVCHAGAAVRWQWNTWSLRRRAADRGADARRAWVLAAAAPGEPAYNGRFSEAVAAVLARLRHDGLDTDPSLEYVPVSLVTREIRATLERLWRDANGLAQHLESTPLALGEEPALRLFRNPRYQPTALARLRLGAEDALRSFLAELDPVLDALHYITRAFGAPDDSVAACLFSGRKAELDLLTPWVNSAEPEPSLAVVTGGPGTGKSALLGMLVCAAHPELRDALWHRLPPLRLPGRSEEFAAVHARGRSAGQLAASIGRQLGLREPASGWSPALLIDALRRRSGPSRPVATIVVDALDEAVRPADVVDLLLLPLADARSRPKGDRPGRPERPVCRLLIGTRTVEEAAPVVERARDGGLLVDLDQADRSVLRDDVAAFVRRHLELSPLYNAGTQEALRERLGTELAAALVPGCGVTGNPGPYLPARLLLHQLLDAERAIGTGEIDAVVARAPRNAADLLELDLARLGDPWARPLLTAIAHARHPGIPASLARVIAPVLFGAPEDPSAPEGPSVPEDPAPAPDDVAATLERVGFYLRRTPDHEGPTLYRLFHQELVDHLRSLPAADGGHAPTAVLRALLSPLRTEPRGAVRWRSAVPYQLRHALEHARDADRADELVADPEFLVHTGPPATALSGLRTPAARELAAVYRMSADRHRTPGADADTRRSVLAVDAMRSGRGGLAALVVRDTAGWTPLWASGTAGEESPVVRLGGARRAARLVEVTVVGGRALVVATGGGWSKTWDLATGAALPLWIGLDRYGTTRRDPGTDGAVEPFRVTRRRTTLLSLRDSYTARRTDGSLVRVRHYPAGLLRISDSRVPVADARRETALSGVRAIASPPEGPLFAVALDSGRIQLIDLDGPRVLLPHRLTGDMVRDGVHSLAVHQTGPDRAVVLAGTVDGPVVWDVPLREEGEFPAVPLTPSDDGVRPEERDDSGPVALVAGADGGEPLAAVATGGSVTLRPLRGGPEHLPRGGPEDRPHGGPERILGGSNRQLTALGSATVNGRRLLAGGSADGIVRVWDVDAPAGPESGARHPGPVTAVTTGSIGGRRVLFSASGGEVWVRELRTGRTVHRITTGGLGVTALAFTRLGRRPVVLVAGSDWSVQVWDAERRAPVGPPLTGHTGRVDALTVGRLDGRPVAVTGGSDNSVAVWDLPSGSLIGAHPTAHDAPVTGLALTEVNGTTRLVSGGEDGAVAFWELTEQALVRNCTVLLPGAVTAVSLTTGPRGPLALTGGADRTVRRWDPAGGEQLGEPLHGHDAAVTALAAGRYGGHRAAFTLATDATLRAWDLAAGHPLALLALPSTGRALAWASPGNVAIGLGRDLVVLREPGR
ncbi:hypothetical protein ACWF94_25675 [Streptomyces sp. NPDC055078]